ncbi:MAG: hypothetical protein OHK93_003795 [Ramalina farinacea]|uniref:Uncharacterized protein n=1 Tax=Ramalina farinacea TaxID=258253 RepID=A0AA43QWG1_9LECA|nr:hypothetical protein [Ramalina farinacea]
MSCIDDETLEFRAPTQAIARWETTTGCYWDSLNGIPSSLHGSSVGDKDSFFPNRVIKASNDTCQLHADLLKATESTEEKPASSNEVRNAFEVALKDMEAMKKINDNDQGPRSTERMAVRRMMACYWNNSFPFSIDLVGAVIRQGTFIEKMHHISCLFSPAARFSVTRLLTKYARFIAITRVASSHGRTMVVPMLDVDLAWHTHQLSPAQYFTYTVAEAGRFINHDDKINDVDLPDDFAWNSRQYQQRYEELYSECTCWYCEAIR